ncbi:hypothetical protein SAMN05216371_3687 [Streptomyces sp. TLI_053]|uniref:DUF3592 domain-containing protein n=1 Tax=Streptomyces sp. TLI_053 TaxID=1855352 RepID=UPI00087CAD6E|nr:DUF3592 domain-containing protein [Streptomyces sp. TLI_053]SDT68297.1 hypothetical protein SAMN05216371_3687 [Streptomyces sp. TLI_053]
METTTATAGGAILALFGGALLLWCAAEARLRHRIRRRGLPAVATVLPESDVHGALDSAPLLSFATRPVPGGRTGGAPGAEAAGELVLTRPRGHTPLRRPAHLVPGGSVRIAYDPHRPARAVLLAEEAGPRPLVADLLWTALGLGCLAAGAVLLLAAA